MTAATSGLLALNRRAYTAREGTELPAPPVRIVHLGLGAFHRAHQAWYTARADADAQWGIAAFTGRSPAAAAELAPQDGLYTLVERGRDADRFQVVPSIVEVRDGADLARFAELLASPDTAVVTLTITEAGYWLGPDGRADVTSPAAREETETLRRALTAAELPAGGPDAPGTAIGRLVLGLEARRRSGAAPIAVVPCDNLPENGSVLRELVLELASRARAELAAWIGESVSFVSTSIDRITPRTTPEDIETVAAATGWGDRAPVVTEPFSDWVLSGRFPAGRPPWETAGARFVDDLEPFERRKLWLLNGAHSLLAYAGLARGYETVAEAIADPACRAAVEELWDEDARSLPADLLELDRYRAALVDRFGNARIAHRLEQIAAEGVAKLRVRIAPVVLAERAAGRRGAGGIRALGAWTTLLLAGRALADAQSPAIAEALRGEDAPARVERLLRLVDARLADDPEILGDVIAASGTTLIGRPC